METTRGQSAVLINTKSDLERFSQSFARRGGGCGCTLLREEAEAADALFDYCQDVIQREKTRPMYLIDAALQVSEVPASHDFIYTVTTLFTRYRRRNEPMHYDTEPQRLLSPPCPRAGRTAAASERRRPKSHPSALLHGRRHPAKVRAGGALGN